MKGRYKVGKIEHEIQNKTNNDTQLDSDLNSPVWHELEEKYSRNEDGTANTPVKYSSVAYNRVKHAQDEIKQGSNYWGVAPQAVAACMLDEQTAIIKRGLLPDAGQDYLAKQESFFKEDRFINYLFDKKAYRTPNEMEKFLNETQTDDDRHLLFAPQKSERLWDLGNYNVNLAVGYKCFERYVLNANEDNPIYKATLNGLADDATKENKCKAFIRNCLTDQQGQALVVSAVLKDGESQLRDFMEERRRINHEEFPEGCYSPEEFNCMVVDTYKKGLPLMKKQYLERVQNGNLSPMKAGPGDGLIFNREMINDCLTQPKHYPKHPRI